MITELARVRSLVVRPSSVIAQVPGTDRDPREIGQELNVSAVLTAGFIHAGERFRVTAQLIDVASGELLWSDRIDTAASDIIVLQDTIAQRIVEGLRVELSPAEQVGHRQSLDAKSGGVRTIPARSRLVCAFHLSHIVAQKIATTRSRISNGPSNSIQTSLSPTTASAHAHVNRVFKGFGGSEDYERAEAGVHKSARDRSEHLRSAHADGVCISLAW